MGVSKTGVSGIEYIRYAANMVRATLVMLLVLQIFVGIGPHGLVSAKSSFPLVGHSTVDGCRLET